MRLVAFSVALWVGVAVQFPVAEADSTFLWGVANSSFQTEGAAGDPAAPAHSDWWEWEHTSGHIKDGSTADVATDFWNRYDEDFALTQGVGGNAFRLSLAWERIQPARRVFNEAAFAHYERMLVAMRARGLEPVVTLMHSAMPLWVSHAGGVLAKTFPDDFGLYAEAAVRRLSVPPASVRYWMTLNEPATMSEGKYLDGSDPSDLYNPDGSPRPVKGDGGKFMKALSQQVEAHLAAAGRIRKLGIPGLKLGVASDWTVIQNKKWDPLGALVGFFARRVYDRFFLDGIVKGTNSLCLLPKFMCPKFKHAKGLKLPAVDYIGLNYYTRQVISTTIFPPGVEFGNGHGPLSESGTEIYPKGMQLALQQIWKYYRLPILVSENGVVSSHDPSDQQRIQFLRDHIAFMQKAQREDRIPVLGYLYWSLTDNFEWSNGYTERLGLVSIDYATLKRTPRPSYLEYAKLIREAAEWDLYSH